MPVFLGNCRLRGVNCRAAEETAEDLVCFSHPDRGETRYMEKKTMGGADLTGGISDGGRCLSCPP